MLKFLCCVSRYFTDLWSHLNLLLEAETQTDDLAKMLKTLVALTPRYSSPKKSRGGWVGFPSARTFSFRSLASESSPAKSSCRYSIFLVSKMRVIAAWAALICKEGTSKVSRHEIDTKVCVVNIRAPSARYKGYCARWIGVSFFCGELNQSAVRGTVKPLYNDIYSLQHALRQM